MSQSLSQLFIHIVFSTQQRKRLLPSEVRPELYAYIACLCREMETPIVKVDGTSDHIHILINHSRKLPLMKLVAEIKSHSSRWEKTKGYQFHNFSWQRGYGAFSIGQSGVKQCADYIANQEVHHHKKSFQEEYIALLKKYNITYDLKYLWD